jgi:hypothetical protein
MSNVLDKIQKYLKEYVEYYGGEREKIKLIRFYDKDFFLHSTILKGIDEEEFYKVDTLEI